MNHAEMLVPNEISTDDNRARTQLHTLEVETCGDYSISIGLNRGHSTSQPPNLD